MARPVAAAASAFSALAHGRARLRPRLGPLYRYELEADAPGAAALIYRRRALRQQAQPMVRPSDLAEALFLAGTTGLAAAGSPASWERVCRLLARGPGRGRARAEAGAAAALAAIFGRADPGEAAVLARRSREHRLRQRLVYAGEVAGRLDAVQVAFPEGAAARLRQALARGRGAIVWVDETYAGPVMAKRGLHAAGFSPSQVSAAGHGVSQTRFGIAVLNPWRVRAENRYLAERLVFDQDQAADVTRRMLKVLRDGGLLSLTNGHYAGSRFIELPLGAGGYLTLATTALGLAVRHEVPLFRLAAIEITPFARYRLELGEEIGANAAASGHADPMVAAAEVVRDGMLASLRRWPEQYPGLLDGRFTTTRFPGVRGRPA